MKWSWLTTGSEVCVRPTILLGSRLVGRRRRLIMVEVEPIPVQVIDRELPQPPGLLLQRLNDVCSGRFQLAVRLVNIVGEYPMDRGCERHRRPAEEDHNVIP